MTRTVLLGDIAKIGDGLHGTPKYSPLGRIPFINGNNLVYGRIIVRKETKMCDFDEFHKLNKRLSSNTVLVSINGTVGNVAMYDGLDYVLGKSACFIDINRLDMIRKDYLYYVCMAKNFQDYIHDRATGTTIKNVPLKAIREYKLILPSLITQERIANILATIDEKIELNRRMNETLEQMGQALFKKYFIDNPEAKKWEECKLGDLTDVNKESLGKDYRHDLIKYVDIASVSTGSVDKYETIELSRAPSRAKRIVRDSDIVWATVRPNRRAYSMIMSPPDNMVVSTGFAVLSPKKNALGFVYYHTSSQYFADYLTLHARGAAYPAVTASDFKNAPVAMPDTETLDEFNKITLPNMRMISSLKNEIQTLTILRDTILPRLINGKVKL